MVFLFFFFFVLVFVGFESRPRNSYSSVYTILNFNGELAIVSGASTINSESWSFSGAFGSRELSLSEGTQGSGCFQGSIFILISISQIYQCLLLKFVVLQYVGILIVVNYVLVCGWFGYFGMGFSIVCMMVLVFFISNLYFCGCIDEFLCFINCIWTVTFMLLTK